MRATLQRWRREDALVGDTAWQRNLQVLGVAALAMVALNLLHVLVFGLLRFDDPVRSAWARQIAWAHAAMLLPMLGTAWVSRRWRDRPAPASGRVCLLPEGVCAVVLGWAMVLVMLDQAVSTSVAAFHNAVVAVALIFLLRPQFAPGSAIEKIVQLPKENFVEATCFVHV